MIHGYRKEMEHPLIMTSESVGEASRCRNLKIIENNDGVHLGMLEGKKKSMFACGGIGRAVDEDDVCNLQALEQIGTRFQKEAFEWNEAESASGKRNDRRDVGISAGNLTGQLFGLFQPFGGIFHRGDGFAG